MKDVNIYIQESCDSIDSKNGSYIALMTTQGGKCRFSNSFSNTTNYRMTIQGAIDAISKLNQPCNINLFTTTTFGMSKIKKADGSWRDFPKSSINIDLLTELKAVILEGGHEIHNIYNKELVDEALEADGNDQPLNHVVLRLNDDIYNKLINKCKKEKRTVNEIVESLLSQYLI